MAGDRRLTHAESEKRTGGDMKHHGASLWTAALFFLALCAPSAEPAPCPAHQDPAPAAEFEKERAAAGTLLVRSLEQFADWCNDNKLFLERDKSFTQILELDPTHERAHLGLRYTRDRDGWVPPPEDARAPKNYDLKMLKEAPAKMAAALKPWRDTILALLDKYKDSLTPAKRDEVYAQILRFDPGDEQVHALLGEIKLEDKWVLAETGAAKERRAAIKELVKRSLESAPVPADIQPTPQELAFGVEWKFSVGTPCVRVLTTGGRDEAVKIAQVTHAVGDYFRAIFGCTTTHPPAYTIYLLLNPGEFKKFLEKYPTVNESNRPFLLTLKGSGLPECPNAAWWDEDPARRLDGLTRHTLGVFFQSNGVSPHQGWAWEGLGLYLTRELIGTRLTWYVQIPASTTSGAAMASLRAKLLNSKTNWMDEAHKLLESPKHPSWSNLFAKDVNAMTLEDVLCSYVFASFLLETKPTETWALLRAIGAGTPTRDAIASVLAMDLDFLDQRVRRWLAERR
jgi:hypothetical protein